MDDDWIMGLVRKGKSENKDEIFFLGLRLCFEMFIDYSSSSSSSSSSSCCSSFVCSTIKLYPCGHMELPDRKSVV